MGQLIPESTIDQDLIAYATTWREQLGLGEWNIWLSEHDAPGGSADRAGHTNLNTRYLRACITLLRSLTPERKRQVIRHELLHVMLAFIDQAVRYTIARLPKKERKQARAIYIDAEEQTIERLVRALQPEADDTTSSIHPAAMSS